MFNLFKKSPRPKPPVDPGIKQQIDNLTEPERLKLLAETLRTMDTKAFSEIERKNFAGLLLSYPDPMDLFRTTNPTAHLPILDYLRHLWKGGEKNEEFEEKSLTHDFHFNSVNLAELIIAIIQERNLSRARVLQFLRIGVRDGADSNIALLIERLLALGKAGLFKPIQCLLLIDSGAVGDRKEVLPVRPMFDKVKFILAYMGAMEKATLEQDGHEAIDATYMTIEGNKKIEIAAKIWPRTAVVNKQKLIELLKKGVEPWNDWRRQNPDEVIDLSDIDFKQAIGRDELSLRGINLSKANLSGANLAKVDLSRAILTCCYMPKSILEGTNLEYANLQGSYMYSVSAFLAHMSHANLVGAYLSQAYMYSCELKNVDLAYASLAGSNLEDADLSNSKSYKVDLSDSNLRNSNMTGADLSHSNLSGAILVNTNFTKASLDHCNIFGASVWRVTLDETSQENLVVTDINSPKLTVDNLNLAQFIYLILDNPNLRYAIDAISSKTVLILGRFTDERKYVLDQIKKELQKKNYLPIIFDFEGPVNRDLKETVATVAHLAKFIIADITDPRSVPQELMAIVPHLPSVPVQPIISNGEKPWSMFSTLQRYPWMMGIFEYENIDHLVDSIDEKIILPVEKYLKTA